MEPWPADHRPVKSKQKARLKKEYTNALTLNNEVLSSKGPILLPGNGISASAIPRLYRPSVGHGRPLLKWDFMAYEGPMFRTVGTPVVLFPERSSDRIKLASISQHRMAEEGARFLRHRFPDVDIPFDIIKENMQEDIFSTTRRSQELSFRNRLAMIHLNDGSRDHETVFAFPMGNLENELNLSRSNWSRTRGLVFNASASPVATFDTPIHQIVSSNAQNEGLWTLAVRTMSLCSLFSIRNDAAGGNRHSAINLKQLACVKVADSGSVEDIAISPFVSSDVLLIGEMGQVSLMQGDRDSFNTVAQGAISDENSHMNWHIGWTNDTNTALRAGPRHLELLDIRAQDGSATPGIRFDPEERVTALDSHADMTDANDHRILVTTDQRVVWVDLRYPTMPLISWKHIRGRDSTLRATAYKLGSETISLLMSQRNGLIDSFGVSSSNGLLRGSGSSQIQTVPSQFHRAGYALHRYRASNVSGFNLVELSAQGGLFSSYITRDSSANEEPRRTLAAVDDQIQKESITPEWTRGIEGLANMAIQYPKKQDPSSMREYLDVDFEPIYQDIIQRTVSGFPVEAEIKDVRDMMDQMLQIWQESGHLMESIKTTYDVAFDASTEPEDVARSTFLTDTIINSRRANIAFQESRFPSPSIIAKNATWTYDLSDTIKSIRALESALQLQGSGARSDAQRQMEMELALYSHVYSSDAIALSDKYTHNDESLERATELLSLSEAKMPPPLSFSFLKPRPVANDITGESERVQISAESVGEVPDATLGCRLLLSEWELRADPRQFEYINPYPDVPTPALKDAAPGRFNMYAEPNRSQPFQRPVASANPSQARSAPPRIGISQSSVTIAPSAGASSQPVPASASVSARPTMAPSSQVTRPSVTPTLGRSQITAAASSQNVLSKSRDSTTKTGPKKAKKRMGGF